MCVLELLFQGCYNTNIHNERYKAVKVIQRTGGVQAPSLLLLHFDVLVVGMALAHIALEVAHKVHGRLQRRQEVHGFALRGHLMTHVRRNSKDKKKDNDRSAFVTVVCGSSDVAMSHFQRRGTTLYHAVQHSVGRALQRKAERETHTHTHTHTTKVNSRRKLVPGSAAASCRVCVERHERSR